MPVTFSRRVVGEIEPKSFTVRTKSGALLQPRCATLFPADAAEESHTVLLIGKLGDEPADPPIAVDITGALGLEGGISAQGMSGNVIALADGPTLALALRYQPGEIPSDCPSATKQIIMAVWTGGITPGPGSSQATHQNGYRVKVEMGEVQALDLADTDDSDNYVHVCLDVDSPAQSLSFVAGVLVDPRGDLNPATTVAISGPP